MGHLATLLRLGRPRRTIVSGSPRMHADFISGRVGTIGAMAVVKTSPMKLPADPWVEGYVLDYHTVSSTPTGDPYYRFDTKRTELGELLYRAKYRGAPGSVIADIADTVAEFIGNWKPTIDCIVTAPHSVSRKTQPLVEIARGVADRVGLQLSLNALTKVKETVQMKNVDDWSERKKLLAEAIQIGGAPIRGKRILLMDDLIESGSTLRRAADVLLGSGGAAGVYALVLTRTK